VTRLDALGQRLTSMAGLEDGEFNFAAAPAMGGPETFTERYEATVVTSDEVVSELLTLERQLDDRRRQLEVLESLLLTRTVAERVAPAGMPVEGGWISSAYGTRTDPITDQRAFHAGMDFAGRAGMPIKAVADGVVTWSARRYGYGNLVELTHGNGLVTRYAHNQDNLVAVGDRVTKGQIIASMGDTGRATGPNLHFEVLRNGRTVNPISYVRSKSR
ncbi:MAG: M23 family metallopeptidase, partial [Pseudomonadota bacterium]